MDYVNEEKSYFKEVNFAEEIQEKGALICQQFLHSNEEQENMLLLLFSVGDYAAPLPSLRPAPLPSQPPAPLPSLRPPPPPPTTTSSSSPTELEEQQNGTDPHQNDTEITPINNTK
uniref:Uncharacterized protein n=1 Tax=Salix viminalis TaxID=40686 RepID=A0A6N2MPJ7_SALVM